MIRKKVLTFCLFLILPATVHAYWVWSPEEGKFVNPDEAGKSEADEQFAYAMKLYNDRNLDDAIDEFKKILKKQGGSRIAPEAQYRLGTLYEEKGDYWEAFEAYKKILESYPQSERIDEVVEREFRIGNVFLSGRKGKLMGLEILPSLPRAIEIFEHIVKNAPFSQFGDEAQFRLGLALKEAGRFDEAVDAFQAVIDNYPQSEHIPEAQFQLADTSFRKSNAAARDQRAMEKASTYVDGFLMRYPETTATEKATKLRQEIDEKNAEKNYRIGVYYEKDDYLSSAIIYYRDVARRYPHTQWGQKAAEKLKALEQPVSYMGDQAEKINAEIGLIEAQLDKKDELTDAERGELKRRLERLKQKRKLMEENKEESLKSREEDIHRREKELEEKVKKLAKKKKMFASNQSEDFQRAMERWEASLQKEREEIEEEKRQLKGWKESLGMEDGSFWAVLPFVGEEATPLEEVRQVDAKKLFKVSEEKKDLLEEKELLYKQYQEVSTLLNRFETARTGLESEEKAFTGAVTASEQDLEARRKKLEETKAEISRLKDEIEKKNDLYKKNYGESAWKAVFSAPARMMTSSAEAMSRSLGALNPFDGSEQNLDSMTLDQLLELRMHLQEKVAARKAMVDILSQAFDETLAMQEQQRILESLEEDGETDAREIRKAVKEVEKEIRTAYQEIGDRHERIKALTGELESLMKKREESQGTLDRAAAVVTAPARLVVRGTRDFLFGRPSREEALTESAGKLPAEGDETASRAREIKDEIELESLLIEARNREIYQLRRRLDALKTKASLGGGYKFRSSMVTVPYEFLEDALDSARSVVPKKDRKEMLINKLNEETAALEANREKLKTVEAEIASRETSAGTAEEAPVREEKKELDSEDWLEEEMLRQEIQGLSEKLEAARMEYERSQAFLDKEAQALDRETEEGKETKDWEGRVEELGGKQEKLHKEMRALGKELAELIGKEGELEGQEAEILEKRINKIDRLVQEISSKAMAQDLLSEKIRLEERLSQIQARRDFLAREQDRFDISKTKVA